jgi:hypothetical protein
MIEIEYDPAKNATNIRDRALCFERAREFEFNSALIGVDERQDYGETRYVAIGYLGGRLHVLCFTETENGIRVISFRKANSREAKRYVNAQTID